MVMFRLMIPPLDELDALIIAQMAYLNFESFEIQNSFIKFRELNVNIEHFTEGKGLI